jgi:hypothetical protein
VTSSGGLSRIDVTNDDDVNVSLFLTHGAKEMDESLDAWMHETDGWMGYDIYLKRCAKERKTLTGVLRWSKSPQLRLRPQQIFLTAN